MCPRVCRETRRSLGQLHVGSLQFFRLGGIEPSGRRRYTSDITENGFGDVTGNGFGDVTENGFGDITENGFGDVTENGFARVRSQSRVELNQICIISFLCKNSQVL